MIAIGLFRRRQTGTRGSRLGSTRYADRHHRRRRARHALRLSARARQRRRAARRSRRRRRGGARNTAWVWARANRADRSRSQRRRADSFASQVLFLFVRATDTLRALRPFVNELDPACVIVSLQNGISNEDAVKASLGGNVALVIGATTESALTTGPGTAEPLGTGTTILGPGRRVARGVRAHRATAHRRGHGGVGRLRYSPASVGQADRERGDQSGRRAARPAQRRDSRATPNAGELARSLAQEAAAVASAMRIALPFDDPWSYVRSIVEQTSDLRQLDARRFARRRENRERPHQRRGRRRPAGAPRCPRRTTRRCSA